MKFSENLPDIYRINNDLSDLTTENREEGRALTNSFL